MKISKMGRKFLSLKSISTSTLVMANLFMLIALVLFSSKEFGFFSRAASYSCPTTSTQNYVSVTMLPPKTDRPADQHPDLNLQIRGYVQTNEFKGLVDQGDFFQPQLPQLYYMFADPSAHPIVNTYQVYDWDWLKMQRGSPMNGYDVTLIGLAASPGEPIMAPNYPNLGPNVLYAYQNGLTLKWGLYGNVDNVISQFTVHIDDICVDPNLLALYNKLNAEGRDQLPQLLPGRQQPLGYARTNEVKVAIRDTGEFEDPRSLKDWWWDKPSPLPTSTVPPGYSPSPSPVNPTPSPTPKPTPTNGGQNSCSCTAGGTCPVEGDWCGNFFNNQSAGAVYLIYRCEHPDGDPKSTLIWNYKYPQVGGVASCSSSGHLTPIQTPTPTLLAGTNMAPQASFTASSYFRKMNDYAPYHVADGVYNTAGPYEWASDGELAGAWIRLDWKSPVTVNKVTLYDRTNNFDHVTLGTLLFSDGSSVPFGSLPNDGATPLVVNFSNRTITWANVRIDVAEGYNIGFAEVGVYGTPATASRQSNLGFFTNLSNVLGASTTSGNFLSDLWRFINSLVQK